MIGEINIFCNIVANKKQFDIKLFLIVIANIIYTHEIIVDIVLYIFLLFSLIIGFLYVSAGEKKLICSVDMNPIDNLKYMFTVIFLINKGIPIKIIVEAMRHIQLLDACIPNEGILIIE